MSILRRFNSITMAQLPVVFFDITAGGQPVGRIEMTVSPAACGLASAESHLLKDSELQISPITMSYASCACLSLSLLHHAICIHVLA